MIVMMMTKKNIPTVWNIPTIITGITAMIIVIMKDISNQKIEREMSFQKN